MFPYNDNLLIMENDTQDIFVEGIKKLFADENRERKRLKKEKLTWSKIADSINVTSGNLSGFLTSQRNYSETKQKELAKFFNKTYLEVLDIGRLELLRDGDLSCAFPPMQMTGQASNTPPPQVINLQEEADKRHAEVISGFQDKELALEINQLLIKVEQRDPNQLKMIKGIIEGVLNTIPAKEDSFKKGLMNGTDVVK